MNTNSARNFLFVFGTDHKQHFWHLHKNILKFGFLLLNILSTSGRDFSFIFQSTEQWYSLLIWTIFLHRVRTHQYISIFWINSIYGNHTRLLYSVSEKSPWNAMSFHVLCQFMFWSTFPVLLWTPRCVWCDICHFH